MLVGILYLFFFFWCPTFSRIHYLIFKRPDTVTLLQTQLKTVQLIYTYTQAIYYIPISKYLLRSLKPSSKPHTASCPSVSQLFLGRTFFFLLTSGLSAQLSINFLNELLENCFILYYSQNL